MQESIVETRNCNHCGEEKSLAVGFKKLFRGGRIYFSHECHKCKYSRKMQWLENPENRRKTNAQRREYSERVGKKKRLLRRTPEVRVIEAAKAAAYRLANPEKVKATVARYFRKNSERLKRKREENRERLKPYNREKAVRWRKRHPEKPRLAARAQRAKRRAARIEIVTQKQIVDLFSKQIGRCAICKKKLEKWHVDHIHPISRGGAHEIRNLQLLCPPCNMAKHNTHPIVYMQKLGFLL